MTRKFNYLSKLLMFHLMFASAALSQNITNTLGTGGIFTIKDASNDYLALNQSTGQVNILRSLRLENTTSSNLGILFKGTERFLHNFGTDNTFLGINSGNFTMTGCSNTAVGQNSFFSNTTGTYNAAIGNGSLYSNTTGFNNTAVGWASLVNNTSGSSNTAFGNSSLYFNTTGINNTAVGTGSLYYNTTGFNNTAVGLGYLEYNTTGTYNTAVGKESLFSNTTGYNNTAVGWNSLYSSTIGHSNTAVGYNSGVGVGGNNVTCIGVGSGPSSGLSSDQVILGNYNVTSLRCNVQTITGLSDERDKKNIIDLSLGLDFLMKIKPRLFYWDRREWYENNISDGSKMKKTPSAGFIAQELDAVQTTENAEWLNLVLKDNPEKLEATSGNLLPVMVKAIQELKAENDMLKQNNEKLTIEVQSLKSICDKIATLEQTVNKLNSIKLTSPMKNVQSKTLSKQMKK